MIQNYENQIKEANFDFRISKFKYRNSEIQMSNISVEQTQIQHLYICKDTLTLSLQ